MSASQREQRAQWPIVRYRLGDEPGDDLSDVSSAAERIAMMWPLAQAAWTLAGRPLPAYQRGHIPAVLHRVRPPDDDDDA